MLSLTTAPHVVPIHLLKDLLDAAEQQAKGDFIPSTLSWTQLITLVFYFLLFPSFDALYLLLLLLAHGPTHLAMGLVTVTLSHLCAHFLSPLALPVSQLSWEISQLYFVTKSAAYSPLIIIFQISPAI